MRDVHSGTTMTALVCLVRSLSYLDLFAYIMPLKCLSCMCRERSVPLVWGIIGSTIKRLLLMCWFVLFMLDNTCFMLLSGIYFYIPLC